VSLGQVRKFKGSSREVQGKFKGSSRDLPRMQESR
jgi:hypothetical protein